jgi:hypothetical protein
MSGGVARADPGLFVFGPDRSRIMRLRYWRAARAIRSHVTTLIWLVAEDAAGSGGG